MQLTRHSQQIRFDSLGSISLIVLILSAGCFRWVSIEPGLASGQARHIGKVRIGGEGGEIVENVQLSWPTLVAVKEGQVMTLDLRQTPVARRELTRGGVAAIVVPSVLGGVALTTLLLMLFAVSAASVAGG